METQGEIERAAEAPMAPCQLLAARSKSSTDAHPLDVVTTDVRVIRSLELAR